MKAKTNAPVRSAARTREPEPPRPTEGFLGHLLVGAAMRLRVGTAQALSSLEVSPREFGLMNQIVVEPQMTQAQIGERLGIDRTTIVAMLDRLVAMGWIERLADPNDRRVYRLVPTAAGAAAHRQAATAVLDVERRFLAPLGATEAARLTNALRLLRDSRNGPDGQGPVREQNDRRTKMAGS